MISVNRLLQVLQSSQWQDDHVQIGSASSRGRDSWSPRKDHNNHLPQIIEMIENKLLKKGVHKAMI